MRKGFLLNYIQYFFIYIINLIFLISIIFYSCGTNQKEKSNQSVLIIDTTYIDSINEGYEVNSQIEFDSLIFNPNYKPFFGGLTVAKLWELYRSDNTASGMGNPLKILCHSSYADSGTGIYYYYNRSGFDCDVSVSIWNDGFYNGDTSQRINNISVYHRNCKFNYLLPFQVGQRINTDSDSLISIDSSIVLYRKEDYEFYLLTQNRTINAIYIKRNYCRDEVLDIKILNQFKNIAIQRINMNK